MSPAERLTGKRARRQKGLDTRTKDPSEQLRLYPCGCVWRYPNSRKTFAMRDPGYWRKLCPEHTVRDSRRMTKAQTDAVRRLAMWVEYATTSEEGTVQPPREGDVAIVLEAVGRTDECETCPTTSQSSSNLEK